MSEPRDNHPQTAPTPRFPWKHVLFTALAVLAIVGLIILIRKGGRGYSRRGARSRVGGSSCQLQKGKRRSPRQRTDRHGILEGTVETGGQRESGGDPHRIENCPERILRKEQSASAVRIGTTDG